MLLSHQFENNKEIEIGNNSLCRIVSMKLIWFFKLYSILQLCVLFIKENPLSKMLKGWNWLAPPIGNV
jgi:hypothetical protein